MEKKKTKSIIFKILTICMILCFAFISVGCLGMPGNPEGIEGDDDGVFDDEDFQDNLTVDMYGTKVLYRPDDYDYDQGSGAGEGETNNYYGKYAYYIMQNLFQVYGMLNSTTVIGTPDDPGILPNFNNEATDMPWGMDMTSYLYDSIRYQVDSLGYVTHSQMVTVDSNGNITGFVGDVEEIGDSSYYVIGADTNVKWNWTISSEVDSLFPYVNDTENRDDVFIVNQDGRVYKNVNGVINEDQNDITSAINTFYTNDTTYMNLYQTLFLSSTLDENDEYSYSQYVKALEYVIYCYAVDLEPAEVTITHETDINGNYKYTVNVAGFQPEGELTSVEVALNYAKYLFSRLGSYVGLVDRQITKIENWILENIIGEMVINNDDLFTFYTDGVVEYLGVEEDNEENVIGIVGYSFTNAQRSENALGRDYRTAVQNIMDSVCELVSIGNDDGEDVTIDQRFLASNIMEYAGNMFFIQDDTNFPAPSDDSSISDLNTLLPLEYQSVAIMLSEETYVDGLWVALKYDADLDGTEEGVYGDQYIDIIVDLNYYNNATDTRTVLDSKQVRVYDGPYDLDFIYSEEGDGGDGESAPEGHCSGVMFDDLGQLLVGAFKTDIGDGILMTDVGTVGNYEGAPYVSTNPLVIVGTTDVRKYYEIVEFGTNPEYDTDELEDGYTYTSGRFNPAMFSGTGGCDYLEITYKVIKRAGDYETNYKFYTGLAFMDTSEDPYLS